MRVADVQVLTQWTVNLQEFPVSSIYCAESSSSLAGKINNAVVRRLQPVRNRFTLPSYVVRRLRRQIKTRTPDLIYCIFGWNASQLLDVLDSDGCRGVPFVFLAGGSDINAAASLGPEYLKRLRGAFDRAALILCGSQFLMSKVLQAGAPASKVRLHYIGRTIPTSKQMSDLWQRDDFKILAVSRLSPVKGVRHTVAAFAKVCAEMPNSILEIIGEGEEMEACRDLAKALNVSQRVHFKGSQSIADVYTAMRSADLLVQHNVRTADGQEESIPGSTIEASAHGLPVIGTRSGGVNEIVVDGETGLLVEPGDENSMAESMLRLYRDPELRSRYGRAGRERAKRLFDMEKQNNKLEQMLLEVCGHTSIAPGMHTQPLL